MEIAGNGQPIIDNYIKKEGEKVLTDAQKKAVNKYQKENLEIVSFRVKKGKRAAYNELSKKKSQPLSQILENYLDNECNAAGINPTKYIIKKEGEKE